MQKVDSNDNFEDILYKVALATWDRTRSSEELKKFVDQKYSVLVDSKA